MPRQVQAALANDGVLLLDCREAEEVQIAAIPGAVHIPMDQIPRRQNELDDDKHIVVFCHHGVRSLSVAVWLKEQAGFEQVSSMRGGIDAWSREVDPAVPRY
jgi:rhodanese-related sulfurtransferase